jgi:hypothetical protein
VIKIFVDGEEVHSVDARAYRKRMLHVDFRQMGKSTQQEHIGLPVIRDLDIHLNFDVRADTDLLMLEEKARLDEADKDAEKAEANEVPEDTTTVEEEENG